MRRVHPSRGGFQLLEVTSAIFVLTVGVFGIITLLQQGLTGIRASQADLIAGQALVNEIETLRATLDKVPRADTAGEQLDPLWAPGSQPFRSATPGLARLHNAFGTSSIRPRPDLSPGLFEIHAVIRWTGGNGRTIEKSLTTLAAQRQVNP